MAAVVLKVITILLNPALKAMGLWTKYELLENRGKWSVKSAINKLVKEISKGIKELGGENSNL